MIIQSDNRKEFINKKMSALCERFLPVFKHSRPRYSQTNGQIERFNQTLTRYLQKHIFEDVANEKLSNKLWLKHLNKVMYNYNLAKHSSTKKSPFSLRLQIPGYNTVFIDNNNEQKDDLDLTQADCDEITLLSNKKTELLSEENEKTWEPSVSLNFFLKSIETLWFISQNMTFQ
ncbi:Transposon Tf2-9 polyprotein [Cucumispora dikerogammari]|nr:Transposon Tf2-9 polyprotein [Cucumispora dikerogammari]